MLCHVHMQVSTHLPPHSFLPQHSKHQHSNPQAPSPPLKYSKRRPIRTRSVSPEPNTTPLTQNTCPPPCHSPKFLLPSNYPSYSPSNSPTPLDPATVARTQTLGMGLRRHYRPAPSPLTAQPRELMARRLTLEPHPHENTLLKAHTRTRMCPRSRCAVCVSVY